MQTLVIGYSGLEVNCLILVALSGSVGLLNTETTLVSLKPFKKSIIIWLIPLIFNRAYLLPLK